VTRVDDVERRARVLLSRVVEPGDPDACRLVAEFSAGELLDRVRQWAGGDSAKLGDWRERLAAADHGDLMGAAEAVGARYICPGDDEWPTTLGDLARCRAATGDRRGGAPFGLWVRGDGDLAALSASSIGIVGSRASSAYGDRMAGQLAFDCAGRGVIAISGGAYGIDAAAHRGALSRERPTVAVLAGGIDRLYPSGNSALLRRIAGDGVVVAEAAPGAAARKSRFLVRNRLIAALTQGTVVVEAAWRSGSLNTARWAGDLGRAVMGVPGPVTSTTSGGVHELLRQPGTLLVTDAAEVIEHISAIGSNLAPRKQGPRQARDDLTARARRLLDAMPKLTPATTASLASASGIASAHIAGLLDELTAARLVVTSPAGWRLADPEPGLPG
jgi:DNA processing protein